MCGICGLVSLTGERVDRDVVTRMNDALSHRGPDAAGVFCDGVAAIANRRLSIIDLAGGDQPIANEDGTVHVVQNGEIYNYRELKEELEGKGHQFRTNSDTEVLVHLYEEHGPTFAKRLRGMFAVAIWDVPRRRFVLTRDQYGIKPMYYRMTATSISFASELKALLQQPGFSKDIDLDALEAYLAYSCIPAPLTIFRDAKKLPAGHVMVWEGTDTTRTARIERYAAPLPGPSMGLLRRSEEDLAEEIRERLADSVKAHLIADVPVGVLLSGGVDSSALAALASENGASKVSTFTIGFDEAGFDERERARSVAQRYSTDHHEMVLKPNALELLPKMAEIFDEPFADSSAIPTYLVSQLAREHVKVALSGEGGDELFGGYFNYVGHRLAPLVGRAAPVLRPLIHRLPSSTKQASSLDYKAKRFIDGAAAGPLERHFIWKSIFSPELRANVLTSDHRGANDPIDLLRPTYDETDGADRLARIMDVDLRVFLVEDMLVKTDRTSMAQSLEARVPFLDPAITNLALMIPSRHKVRGLTKKRLLRKALAPLVPEMVLNGKKQGFSIPVGTWLREDLQPVVREMLAPSEIRKQGVFQDATVTRLVDQHSRGERDHSRQLWALLIFGLWHQRYAT